jgi:hypothetical protein
MGRDALTPTPNIPWDWNHDDEGNVSIRIRTSEGCYATVVLDRQCAEGFSRQLYNIFWQLDSKARQKRLMTA